MQSIYSRDDLKQSPILPFFFPLLGPKFPSIMINSYQQPPLAITEWYLMFLMFNIFSLFYTSSIWEDLEVEFGWIQPAASCGSCVQDPAESSGKEKRTSLPPHASLQKTMQRPWLFCLPVDTMNFYWKCVTFLVHTGKYVLQCHVSIFPVIEPARYWENIREIYFTVYSKKSFQTESLILLSQLI